MIFFVQFVREGEKKLLILNASLGHEMLGAGTKEGKKDMKDSEKVRS